jgi:hypothetical protein
MRPPTPKSSDRPAATGDTQVIDLRDVELLVAPAEHQRSLPPPLPPEIASHVPSQPPQPPRASEPPLHALSVHPDPAPQAPAPPRSNASNAFYAVALLVFLVVGVGGGLIVAMALRKSPPPALAQAAAPTARPQATVITIPTVEVDDDPDGGK